MDCSSDSDDEAMTEVDAGDCLFDLLVNLKMRSCLNSTQACTIAYWATLAGAKGSVSKLAKKPGDRNTGHYSRHFDSAAELSKTDPRFYMLDVPMYSKEEGCRISKPLACLPLQLMLTHEVETTPNFDRDLREHAKLPPPVYNSHPVVQRHRDVAADRIPVPVALYVDGIGYAKKNSIVGFFLVNLFTQKRHLALSVRKSVICRCGCRGWCSLGPIFEWLHWCLASMARGQQASERHSGGPFARSDGLISSLSGQDCALAACLFLKADMLEFGNTYGFPSTAHKTHPCVLCHTPRDSKILLDGWDCVTSPHQPKTLDEYKAACDRCERWVTLSQRQHTELRAILEYDKRKDSKSSKGLALQKDYPGLGLRKGDRVERCEGLVDAQDFENIKVFPARVCFWRRSEETFVYHRNAIFSEDTGIDPHRSMALDWLHVLSLGVFQTWCSFATHELFDADAWQTRETTISARMIVSTNRMTSDILKWQKLKVRDGRDVSWVGLLDSETFGKKSKPRFGLKGGQTNWYLEYLVTSFLPGVAPKLANGANLLKAGQDLFRLLSLIREHPVTFPVRAQQDFHEHSLSYLSTMMLLVGAKPKDHTLQHLSDRIRMQGSPAYYGNWLDESLNRLLRDVAAGAHASTHDRRILLEWQKAYEAPPQTSTKRRRAE